MKLSFYRYAILALSAVLIGCQAVDLATDIAVSTGAIGAGQGNVLKAGAKASEKFTPENEYYIGRSVAASLLTDTPSVKNPAAQNYVNLIGQSIALASDMPETWGGYHFTITDSDEVNAFAAPGGLIMVSRGLIKCCKNEPELAAVLAHEVAHIQLQHGIKAISKSRTSELGALIAVEAGKEYTGEQLGELTGAFENTVKNIIKTILEKGYAPKQELAADAVAIELMNRIGYTPAALVSVLETMGTRIADSKKGFGKTHPDSSDRIAAVKPNVSAAAAVSDKATAARFKAALGSL